MKGILPNYEAMMPVVLKVLADGVSRPLREVFELVCQDLSGQSWSDRAAQAGHLPYHRTGQAALVSGQAIDNQYLSQFGEFAAFASSDSTEVGDPVPTKGKPRLATTESNPVQTPQEQIDQALAAINQSLADELLAEILAMSPRFFELLVVDLMVAMGYGGSQQDAAQTTRYSSDGGIDGIIKEDRLGLDSIYLQAKRYTDTTVGRPDIQSFAGALDLHKARKGVFITTSGFSREARVYVDLIERPMALID